MRGEKKAPEKKAPEKKLRGGLLLKLAVFCLTAVVVLSLVERQVQLSEKQETLRQLQVQLEEQNLKNEELRASMNDEEGMRRYAERRAREDLDYAKPGEKVFFDAGGE